MAEPINIVYRVKAETEGADSVEHLAGAVDSTDDKFKKSQGSANQFANGARAAGDEAKKTGDKVNAATNGVVRMNDTFSRAARNFLQFVGIQATIQGVFSAVGGGVSKLIDFEDALAELSSITGATGGDLEFLKNQAREVGATSTIAAEDAVRAFTAIGSSRPDLLANKEALAAVTKESIALAEAAKIDLADAGAAVASAMNQFGLGAGEASRIVNTLAAGSLAGAADINDLNESISKVGTVLAANNIPLEKGVGLLETLAEKEIKGAQAGTQLRNITLRMAQAGIGFVNGQFNINKALVDTKARLDGIADPAKRAEEATKLFGLESVTAGEILLENVDRIDEFTKAVTNTTVAYDQQKTNTNTVKAALAGLRNQFTDLILGLEGGTGALRKAITFLSDNLKTIVKVLGILLTAFTTYLITTKAAVILTAAYRAVTATLVVAKALLTGNVTRATAAMRLFGVATKTAAGPIGIVITLLATAVAAFFAFRDAGMEAVAVQDAFTKKLQEAREEREKLGNTNKSIADQVAARDKLNKEQLEALKANIDQQLGEYDRLAAEAIATEQDKADVIGTIQLKEAEAQARLQKKIDEGGNSKEAFEARQQLILRQQTQERRLREQTANRTALTVASAEANAQKEVLRAQRKLVEDQIGQIKNVEKAAIETLDGLEKKRTELQKELAGAAVGSKDFFRLDGELDRVEKRIERIKQLLSGVVSGSVADLQRKRDELARKLRENLVAGSDEFLTTFQQYAEAAELAKKAEDALKLPEADAAAGSLKDLNHELTYLKAAIENLPPGAEFDRIAAAISEIEAAVALLNDAMKAADPTKVTARTLAELEEEKRHFLAMSDLAQEDKLTRARNAGATEAAIRAIEQAGKRQRLLDEIAFEERRLAILKAAGKDKEQEVTQQENKLKELRAQLGAVVDTTADQKDFKAMVNSIIDGAGTIAQAGISAWQAWTQAEEAAVNRSIELQQARVDAVRDIADKGNAAVFEEEKKRLNDLYEERKRVAERSSALAQAQAAAEMVLAIARVIASSASLGPVGVVVGVASALLAFTAGLAQARQAVQAEGPQGFYEGGLAKWSDMGGYTGKGNPHNVSQAVGAKPYVYHKNEYIMDSATTGTGDNLREFRRIHKGRVDIGKERRALIEQAKKANPVLVAFYSLPPLPKHVVQRSNTATIRQLTRVQSVERIIHPGRVRIEQMLTPKAMHVVERGQSLDPKQVDRLVNAIESSRTQVIARMDVEGLTIATERRSARRRALIERT